MVSTKIRILFYRSHAAAAAMRMLYTSDDGGRDAHFDHSQQSLAFLRDGRPDMLVASVDNLVYPQFASATPNAVGAPGDAGIMTAYSGYGTPDMEALTLWLSIGS